MYDVQIHWIKFHFLPGMPAINHPFLGTLKQDLSVPIKNNWLSMQSFFITECPDLSKKLSANLKLKLLLVKRKVQLNLKQMGSETMLQF